MGKSKIIRGQEARKRVKEANRERHKENQSRARPVMVSAESVILQLMKRYKR